jgi:small subunit ribosomal protein S9
LAGEARKPVVGRRKLAVARVRLSPGKGGFQVNGRSLEEYFSRHAHRQAVREPLEAAGRLGQVDVLARVAGGGVTGQAGALRLAVARALARHEEELRPALKRGGLLTRDPRMTERKKYGRPKARKRFQFSKR